MKKSLILMSVIGCLLIGVTGARAQEDVVDMVMEACKPEIENYCSQVTLGEGRMLACFYAHEDKISGRCGYALYEASAQLEQFATAITHVASQCMGDLEKYCAQVEMGEGRVGLCLLENKDKVTEACAQAMDDTGMEAVGE